MSKTLVIVDDNDYVEFAGPIKGRDPLTGALTAYHGTDVEGFITSDPLTNVPVGTLHYASGEIGTSARYPVVFDGAAVTASMAAAADGDTFFRVIRSTTGNFRVVDPVIYKKTRPSD